MYRTGCNVKKLVRWFRRGITRLRISRYQHKQMVAEFQDRDAREHVERRESGIRDNLPSQNFGGGP